MTIARIAPTCLTAEQVAEITEAARAQIEECGPNDLGRHAQWLSDWDDWVVEGWDLAPAAQEEACALAEEAARRRVVELFAVTTDELNAIATHLPADAREDIRSGTAAGSPEELVRAFANAYVSAYVADGVDGRELLDECSLLELAKRVRALAD